MNSIVLTLFYRYLRWDMSSDMSKCQQIIDEIMALNIMALSQRDQGIALFMISEYMRVYDQSKAVETQSVEAMVGHLLRHWQKDDIKYVETLGAVYGGLRGINRFLKNDEISRTIMTIKAFVFDNLIEKGTLCSDTLKEGTEGAMILACVPFGMFEPEDLVFVEAIKSINQKRIKEGMGDHEALLLAWYFVEQGTYSITREILNNTPRHNELYKLVFAKLQDKGGVDEYAIIHKPAGNNNIYEPGNDERFPKLITENDRVIIKAIAYPLSYDNELVLRCNGAVYKGEIMDDLYWQFSMPPFHKGEVVSYQLAFENRPELEAKAYSFQVLEAQTVDGVQLIDKTNSRCLFRAGDLKISFGIGRGDVLSVDVKAFDECPEINKIENKEEKNKSTKNKALHNEVVESNKGNKMIVLEGDETSLEIDLQDFSFKYTKGQETLVQSEKKNWLTVYKGQAGIQQINYKFLSKDEKFYGFGERYNALNQSGNTPDNYVYNQYKEQGLRTYIPMPFYVSNRGYGMLAETSNYSKFDMGETVQGEISIEVEAPENLLKIIPGTINEVIRKNAELIGYPEMLPKWAFGPWMSSNNWDSEKEVRKQVAMTKDLDIPATALVIEAWSDEATFYIFNDAKYDEKSGEDHLKYNDFTFPEWGRWPDPKGMVSYLHDNNLKCVLWQIPVIKQISSLHHLQKDKDEQFFIEKGYGVTHADQRPYRLPEGWFKDSLLMDFSNEAGRDWWFKKRQYLIDDLKVDGFKTDGGEFIFGKDLTFADGRTGREMRNEYANDYIGSYYKFAKENDGITFSRAGYKGANQYPAHWAGDERSTFDAFKRSIMAGLSSGISGLPFWGWDLGGFSGEVPTAELFIRSTQMAAFCPIMQYHAESKAEFNQDRTPWNIRDRSGDERAVSVYRYYANLRMNLLPYIYQQGLKSAETGLPLMKAMVLEYEGDLAVHEIWDQYLFGDNLMVAPIIDEGENQRAVYFPEGEWIQLFTKEMVSGPKKITVDARLEEIPVYVKAHSIIAMNLNGQFELGGKISNELGGYENLCFRVFGMGNIDYTFTDNLDNVIHITVDHSEKIDIKIESTVEKIYLIVDKSLADISINGRAATVEMHMKNQLVLS